MSLAQAYLLLAVILLVPGLLIAVPRGRDLLVAMPRSMIASVVLFGGAAVWFLYGVSQLGESDLAGIPRSWMLGGFGAAAVLAFRYLPDFLSVRGLAGLLLLAMRPVLTAGFGKLPESLVLAAVAYALIFAALIFGTAPYLFRDALAAIVRTPGRSRVAAGGLFAVSLICFVFSLRLVR